MIKEIFLPEKIGFHRILAQRIAGISLHDDCVRLALVHAKKHKTIIEKLVTEHIQPGTEESFDDRAAQSIKKAVLSIKIYDQIRVAIPASIVVFKELQLQFSDTDKIRMVLDYEIESMLPFAINEAIVDFIITKTSKDQPTQVLVAAVRSQDLQEHLSIYEKAGIDPTSITIDLFATYSLYQQIQDYKTIPHATALVEIGHQATRIAFVQDGQLRLTRYIQRGLASIIKLICEETKLTPDDVEKKLITNGLRTSGDEAFTRVAQKHFVLLLNDIQFTLNSFSLKLNFYEGVSKILFTGLTHNIHDFMAFCSDTVQIPCEIFDSKKLFLNKTFKNKVKETIEHWDIYSNTLGIAIPSKEQWFFDLRRKQFAFQRHGLIVKQLSTAMTIIIIMLATLVIKGYMDIHDLSTKADLFEQREINKIRSENIFTKDQFPKNKPLTIVVREADKIVKEKLDIFGAFAQQRMRPLAMWLDLTRIIDKRQFDVSVKELLFTTEEKSWEREKEGGTKKDAGLPKAEVEGIFKSKSGNHYTDFAALENRFRESTSLKVVDPIDMPPAPDSGVNFVIRMKQKEV
jgi:Tfp pilus assembly PilM family ATPase